MNITEVKELIRRELPHVLQTDKTFHYVIRDMLKENFADRQKTEDRFDKVLAEISALRKESQQKGDEQQSEIRALREESQQILKEVQLFIRKYDSSIGTWVSAPNSLSAVPSESFWKSPSGCRFLISLNLTTKARSSDILIRWNLTSSSKTVC